MQVACEFHPDKSPMPRFKFVVSVFFRVRENEAVMMGVVLQPLVRRIRLKFGKITADIGCGKINGSAKLVFRISLIRGKLVGTGTISDFVSGFQRSLGVKR